MINSDQFFESYVPVYDAVPEKWEDARPFIVEVLKKITNGVNLREIGWYLDEELLSGKAFIPGVTPPGDNPGQFRQILRKVIIVGPVTAGVTSVPHGIVVDANFTLIDLWATFSNTTALVGTIVSNSDTINYDVTNINITSNGTYNLCFAFIEYCQES
jgi:hypothetical protein